MHSPEPWKVIPYSGPAPNFRLFGITSADGKTLYAGVSGQTVEQAIANLERIVACVNFCRGISTEDLIHYGNPDHFDDPSHAWAQTRAHD